jgi:hypothetical protein
MLGIHLSKCPGCGLAGPDEAEDLGRRVERRHVVKTCAKSAIVTTLFSS